MPCRYFHAVSDSATGGYNGVFGYCRGSLSDEIRVPSICELKSYCESSDQKGCPVFEARSLMPPPSPNDEVKPTRIL